MEISDNYIYLKIAKFCFNQSNGFTYKNLKIGLEIVDGSWEDNIIKIYLENALKSGRKDQIASSNGAGSLKIDTIITPDLNSIFLLVNDNGNQTILDNQVFILKFDSYFNYLDYLEFKEAVKSAKSAKIYAIIAIIVSALLSLASIGLQLYDKYQIKKNIFNKNIVEIPKQNLKSEKINNFKKIEGKIKTK